jgi:hypothetical protein
MSSNIHRFSLRQASSKAAVRSTRPRRTTSLRGSHATPRGLALERRLTSLRPTGSPTRPQTASSRRRTPSLRPAVSRSPNPFQSVPSRRAGPDTRVALCHPWAAVAHPPARQRPAGDLSAFYDRLVLGRSTPYRFFDWAIRSGGAGYTGASRCQYHGRQYSGMGGRELRLACGRAR